MDMTEDEQLAAVIAASLRETGGGGAAEFIDLDGDEKEEPTKAPEPVVERIHAVEHPEPAADAAGATRVQIRMKGMTLSLFYFILFFFFLLIFG